MKIKITLNTEIHRKNCNSKFHNNSGR